MKKIVMVLLTVLMTVGMHAGNGTRVKVKLSAGSMFTMHRPHRAPAKELVSLYQEMPSYMSMWWQGCSSQ